MQGRSCRHHLRVSAMSNGSRLCEWVSSSAWRCRTRRRVRPRSGCGPGATAVRGAALEWVGVAASCQVAVWLWSRCRCCARRGTRVGRGRCIVPGRCTTNQGEVRQAWFECHRDARRLAWVGGYGSAQCNALIRVVAWWRSRAASSRRCENVHPMIARRELSHVA